MALDLIISLGITEEEIKFKLNREASKVCNTIITINIFKGLVVDYNINNFFCIFI